MRTTQRRVSRFSENGVEELERKGWIQVKSVYPPRPCPPFPSRLWSPSTCTFVPPTSNMAKPQVQLLPVANKTSCWGPVNQPTLSCKLLSIAPYSMGYLLLLILVYGTLISGIWRPNWGSYFHGKGIFLPFRRGPYSVVFIAQDLPSLAGTGLLAVVAL
jgi:hypothetical protein